MWTNVKKVSSGLVSYVPVENQEANHCTNKITLSCLNALGDLWDQLNQIRFLDSRQFVNTLVS